jgi:hypothetical protein
MITYVGNSQKLTRELKAIDPIKLFKLRIVFASRKSMPPAIKGHGASTLKILRLNEKIPYQVGIPLIWQVI